MYFALSVLFVLTTFVQSAPTTPLDAATLLNNAHQAQQLNAQFQNANSSATGPCNNGDTTCVENAIATCVNGQFDTSKGRCHPNLHCFALPSVRSNGTIIACTNEKTVQSLMDAAGATGSRSGGSPGSMNPASPSSTLSGTVPAAAATTEATASMDPDCYATITTATIPTATASQPVVTVTITLLPSVPTTLPPVTQTLSPDQASIALASLLAQGGQVATNTLSGSSETFISTLSASATDIPSSAPPSANTAVTTANNASSSASSGSGYGGYSGY